MRRAAAWTALLGTALGLSVSCWAQATSALQSYVGFDRNDYPGDARLPELRKHLYFVGYWLNNPPGAMADTWVGHRAAVRRAGFGFLLLFNGRLDREILAAARKGTAADTLGRQEGAVAVAAATREGFPPGAVIFLDQEEGGRLLPEQAAYLFGWTEAVATSPYRPGAYVSGQPVPDGIGPGGKPLSITTAQDIQQRIAAQHLRPVVLWVAQDSCPPSPGCTVAPPALSLSGTPGAAVWQYAQSPRRPAQTRSCARTYAPDNLCYADATTDLFLDLDVAAEADPSHGR